MLNLNKISQMDFIQFRNSAHFSYIELMYDLKL